MPKFRNILRTINRVLAFAAALMVLYYEFRGSNKSDSLLLGLYVQTIVSNVYASQLIHSFAASLAADRLGTQQALSSSTTTNETMSAIYLDVSNSSSMYSLNADSCAELLYVDFLYEISSLRSVVEQTLHDYDLSTENSWILVDCTFDGRLLGDSSILKIYLLDRDMVNITTIVLQTVSINRPKHHRSFMGGAATFTTIPLSTLQLESDGITVTTSSPASYSFAVGFDFPYGTTPFERVEVDNLAPPDALWHGVVVNTKEKFTFGGIEGFYRRALEIQSMYGNYYWDLPTDAIEYMTTVQFYFREYLHDAWGWFRCMLGIGISTSLGISTFVSLLVMINLYREEKVLWIPDIYPSIQRLALYRSVLLFVDCLIGSWWRVYQIAMIHGMHRLDLAGTPSLDEITRVDGLMVSLGITYLIAIYFHIRVHLMVVVVVYLVCFINRTEIVSQMGISLDQTNKYVYDSLEWYTIPNEGTMSLWTVFENMDTNVMLILTETTWLVLAISICSVYTLVTYALFRCDSRRVQSWKPNVTDQRNSFRSFSQNTTAHWSKRSMLYKPLDHQDNDYTSFERSVGTIVGHVFGFVASTVDYKIINSRVFVSRNGVWLLGYIVLDGRYAIEIEDYPLFLLNVITQTSLSRVYGFMIKKDMTSNLHNIPWQDFTILGAISGVSLVPLP